MKAGRAPRGGFLVGLVVGLLIGLAAALAVALYVTKVPVPFVNKVPQRTADQDAAEAERNKNWDPNAGLSANKPPARPAAPAGTGTPPGAAPAPAAAPASAPGTSAAAPRVTAPASAAATAAPPKAAAAMTYFAQAGAFTRQDDAEAQRAKLALLGLDAKISEREQAGRTVYRVRVGPFEARGPAEAPIETLQAAGVDSTLVRVERQ